MLILNIAALLAGIVVLAIAADHFVLAAARISLSMRISAVVVGAVVIGFGTSTPELVTGILAASQGSLDIAVGSVVGSNIANLTLIAGAAAAIAAISIASVTLRREAPLAIVATVVLALTMLGGLSRIDGLILAGAFAIALAVMLAGARGADAPLAEEVDHYATAGPSPGREWLRAGAGLIGVVLAAQGLVWGASGLAAEFGVSDAVIGLTVVAIGTSLPELVTAIQAARRGEPDLIVGNLLGSTVFNSLGIVAVATLIRPGPVDEVEVLPVIVMVGVTALAGITMWSGRRLARGEGVALILLYAALLPLVVL